jgi:hypothetical protein
MRFPFVASGAESVAREERTMSVDLATETSERERSTAELQPCKSRQGGRRAREARERHRVLGELAEALRVNPFLAVDR